MRVKILSWESALFDGTAQSLTLPTTQGVVTILDQHINYAANVIPGTAIIDEHTKIPLMQEGMVKVEDNECHVVLWEGA